MKLSLHNRMGEGFANEPYCQGAWKEQDKCNDFEECRKARLKKHNGKNLGRQEQAPVNPFHVSILPLAADERKKDFSGGSQSHGERQTAAGQIPRLRAKSSSPQHPSARLGIVFDFGDAV
jgi:hypothetical protein